MKSLLILLMLPAFIMAACGAQEQAENNTAAEDKSATEPSDHTQAQDSSGLEVDPKPKKNSPVVATVNGVPIYESELNGRPVQQLITDEVLYQKGLGDGLGDKYAEKIREYRKQLIVHEIKTNVLENQPPTKEVSDEEIKDYYDLNAERYSFVRMHEVGFTDKTLGDEILEKVKSGEDLTEIVNAYVEVGANVVGRDLGYNREMVKKFDALEVGSVTEILEKPDGSFGVIKIVEIKPIPLHQTERAIRRLLEAKRISAANENYANQIIQENGVEVDIMQN